MRASRSDEAFVCGPDPMMPDVEADLPYACKAGVCCTCRARLIEGEVRMDANYTLEDDEVARGFRLTCQSHPVTPTLVLDYDQR